MGRTPRGYVFRRADGRWVAEITHQGRTHTRYRHTKKAAEAALRELRRQVLQPPMPAGPTLAAFADQWLATADLSPTTAEGYRRVLARHILPTLGAAPLSTLTTPQLAARVAQARTQGPRAAENTYVVLHRLLQVATDWGLLPANPAAGLSRPRVSPGERTIWTPQQTAAFTAQMQDEPDGAWSDLFLLALFTGLRTAELLGLDWADIRLAQATLSVRRNLVELDGRRFVTRPLKTRASRREISLPPQAVAALLHRGGFAGPVFRHPDGTPPTRSTLRSALVWACRRAGVPYLGMHGLRHQHCTMLAWAGVPLKVAQQRMGHATATMTLAIYTHTLPEDHTAAAQALGELFT